MVIDTDTCTDKYIRVELIAIREFGIRKNKKKTWEKIGNLAGILYIYS